LVALLLLLLLLQDRWFALSGSGGAEVRLRMTLLPGTLPSSSSSSGVSSTAASAASSSSNSSDVSEMLSFFHKNLLGSSRESVMVEVRHLA
jgi:hypothetical protein